VSSGGGPRDAVSDSGGVVDHGRLAEFPSQPGDRDPDGLGEGVGVLIPRLREEILGAERTRTGAQERFENRELLGGEL
jgi:hypothetical protein